MIGNDGQHRYKNKHNSRKKTGYNKHNKKFQFT